jgi:hypothetical protein
LGKDNHLRLHRKKVKSVAAMALYNCAALSEYFSRHVAAKSYLEEALEKQYLMEASTMLYDY